MTTAVNESPAEREKATAPLPRTRLGEELPIFCERCGYSFNGLPMSRCGHCTILQFHCPECGHHQPINTLRPAFQVLLGRLRAAFLAGMVLLKLCVIFWPLVGWVGMGVEWGHSWQTTAGGQRQAIPARINLEMVVAFMLFGVAYGAVGRMMLLRWRRGWLVGASLAGLVLSAVALGAKINHIDRRMIESPFTPDFLSVMLLGAICVVLGASIVWGIWTALAHAFLPRHIASALLDWQRFHPRQASALARE